MKTHGLLTTLTLIFSFVLTVKGFSADEISRNELPSEGKSRSYYLFVPKSIKKENPSPLLALFHGIGRNGRILIEHWQKLAEREGVILARPDALNPAAWATPADDPKFIYDLIEALKSRYAVDPQRVYLFGHTAGANFGLRMSLMESNYFAAAAVSAGAVQQKNYALFERAERKIPIVLFVGTQDPFYPLSLVRETRDAFSQRDFIVELTEISGLDHDYYSRSKEINQKAWNFLKQFKLVSGQRYKKYQFRPN